jgi:L-threonylcarbamoyladenylate synthase
LIISTTKLIKWENLRMPFISNCTASAIKDAATALINGDLIAFPTETVYGLGADATNKSAVNKIYKAKGRPSDHLLIIHISNLKNLDLWARDIPEYAIKLARAFWPGPMTLILPRTDLAKDFITGGQDKVGIRIPSQILALALLTEFENQGGAGVGAPSANRFGAVSPTTAAAVESELGQYLSNNDLILDGGSCDVGVESSIIDCTTHLPIILRPGAITAQMIQELTSLQVQSDNTSNTKTSGLLQSHYSPKAKVVLDQSPKPGEGFIALGNIKTPQGVIRLAAPTNNEEYAKNLYQAFHDADKQQIQVICVRPPDGDDIAVAIRDRLKKAAYKG